MGLIGSSFSLLCLLTGYYLGRKHLRSFDVTAKNHDVGNSLPFSLALKEKNLPREADSSVNLKNSDLKWTSILNALPFPIWVTNEKHTAVYKNRAYEAFEKYVSLKEHVDAPVFHPSQESPFFEKVKKSGRECKGKFTRSILGQMFTFDVWATPNDPAGILCFASDVSEYEREQRHLKKSFRHFESIFDQLPMGIAVWGKNQRLQKFNSRFVRFFQLDEKWLARHPLLDEVLEHLRHKRLLPEVIDFSEYKRRFQTFFTSTCRPHEELVHLPDERSFRFLSTAYPEGGLLWVFEDLTEPLTLKRKHNAIVSVFGAISHHMREGILVLGVDRKVSSINSVCADFWGLDPQQSIQRNFSEILDSCRPYFYYPHYFCAYKNTLISRILSRTPHKDFVYRRDGLFIQCEYVPLPNGEHFLKFMDVTESQKLKGLLYESRRLLMVDQYLFLRRVQQFKVDLLQDFSFVDPHSLKLTTPSQSTGTGKLLELLQNTQNALAEHRPVVRERFLLTEILDDLLKVFDTLIREKKLQLLLVGVENVTLLSNKILFTRFLSRLIGLGFYEATPETVVVFSVRSVRGRISIVFSLKATENRSGEFSQAWYHPWDLGLALLKEMAALSGGVLSAGTAHPRRMRLVCTFQDHLNMSEAGPKNPRVIPFYKSARQTRDAACG